MAYISTESQFQFNRNGCRCLNIDTGISDYHNLIAFSTKIYVPKPGSQYITYRSYKNFDESQFKHDLSSVPYHVSDIFEDYDDKYWFNHKLIQSVIEDHAPLKHKRPVKKPVPYINSELRKACLKKAMLRNKYHNSGRLKSAWEAFRQARNHVAKLKAVSIKKYFSKKCNTSELKARPSQFWNTIKPFIPSSSRPGKENISLLHDDKVTSDPTKVCNIFNEYFSNVADSIGNETPIRDGENIDDILKSYKDHDSVKLIRSTFPNVPGFEFRHVAECEVRQLLKNVDPRKATGCDGVPPKLLKAAANELALPITSLINQSIDLSCFPSECKKAEWAPMYKDKDHLLPNNYRPVSILTAISKIFEKVFNAQFTVYFDKMLSIFLSAFRKRYGCHHVLTKLIEDIKRSLDDNKHVGLILLDLSKAFDCLPHRLLLCKLHAYGVSKPACSLVYSYLSDRLQRVRITSATSDWSTMLKGVPQGSVLGPLLFNVFMNDIFYELGNSCPVYNYADDNTLGYAHNDMNELKYRLEDCATMALSWFDKNHMRANAAKFQAIIIKARNTTETIEFCVSNEIIKPVSCVRLLGVYIDDKLTFEEHVSRLCIKAARQTNALRRISKYLSLDVRLMIFHAFIASNFHYCNIVWHFCSSRSVYKLEKVHKNALRVVLNDYESSYSELLTKAKRPSLYVSRVKGIAMETFKCIMKINPEYVNTIFNIVECPYNLRGGIHLEQARVNTSRFGLNSFMYEGAKTWNNLPYVCKAATSIADFKALVNTWSGPSCQCGSCILCHIRNM